MKTRATRELAPQRANNAYQARNVFGRSSLYLNWGLGSADTCGFDEAALALILNIGRLAGIGPRTRLLDVGFGFGDQLIDWCRHADLTSVDGVNLCPEQTAIARGRIQAAGLAERVRLHVGDATNLPFDAARFDAVTAVECAFHFHTREHFFYEARRVLKQGGRLVLADFIGTERRGTRQRLVQRIAARHWGFARESFCTAEEYAASLRRAGFHDISIEHITKLVIPPGMHCARRRLWEPDLRCRMQYSAWVTTVVALGISRLLGDPLPGEYVLVRAVC